MKEYQRFSYGLESDILSDESSMINGCIWYKMSPYNECNDILNVI